jgi:hypothetical protein
MYDDSTPIATVPDKPPHVCPYCGRLLTPPFDLETSRLLDWLLQIEADIHHLKGAVEEAMP